MDDSGKFTEPGVPTADEVTVPLDVNGSDGGSGGNNVPENGYENRYEILVTTGSTDVLLTDPGNRETFQGFEVRVGMENQSPTVDGALGESAGVDANNVDVFGNVVGSAVREVIAYDERGEDFVVFRRDPPMIHPETLAAIAALPNWKVGGRCRLYDLIMPVFSNLRKRKYGDATETNEPKKRLMPDDDFEDGKPKGLDKDKEDGIH